MMTETKPLSGRRILITGGAGFIGTHLAERLASEAEIILFDSFRRNSLARAPQLNNHPNIRIMSGDVLDAECLKRSFEGVDMVLHLAAIAGVSSYYAEPLRTLQTNILGTVNTLETAVQAGVHAFIYFSTSEVYGANALWVSETSPCQIGPVSDLRWVYATSKLAGENLSLRYAEKYGFGCIVIRPFNIYGPRQVGEGAISNFCRAVAQHQPMLIYGDGSAIRAWCYISDLVDAVYAALSTPAATGQVFNIGNPQEVETTLGLARRIARLAPGAEWRWQGNDHSELRARIPAIDKARRILRSEPRVNLDEGLARTLDWFIQDRLLTRNAEPRPMEAPL